MEKADPQGATPSWECGEAMSGPGSMGHPGQWATNLKGNHSSQESSALVSPPLDLATCAGANVRAVIEHWWSFEGSTGNYDGGIIEVSPDDGMTWDYVTPTVGGYYMGSPISCAYPPVDGQFGYSGVMEAVSQTWTITEVDLTPYAGNPTVRVRLVAGTDQLVNRPGWYVDRFELVTD